MNLSTLASEAASRNRPVRVGLIGAGKFGSMFLSQVPTIAGIEVTAIAELEHAHMVAACTAVGWDTERIDAVSYEQSGAELAKRDDVDVVIEATGNPRAGTEHALAAIEAGKHVVMVNVEADVMVCWLFVGSWTFASIFSYLGGHDIIEHWVLAVNLEPWQFLVLAQLIIFLLGWPLEWSEILIIFVPIFLPMLETFGINPYFFAMLVALNLQTSFLTPPMAMSAYYLKGVLKNQIELMQIFKGIVPYLGIVIFCMVMMYQFPGLALWFPDYLFGKWVP